MLAGMAPGNTTQPIGPRFITRVARAALADRAQGLQGIVDPAGDHHLLLGADDEVAGGQDRLQTLGDIIGLDVTLLARAVAGEAPEIRAIVDVEGDPAAVLLGVLDREFLRGRRVGAARNACR